MKKIHNLLLSLISNNQVERPVLLTIAARDYSTILPWVSPSESLYKSNSTPLDELKFFVPLILNCDTTKTSKPLSVTPQPVISP